MCVCVRPFNEIYVFFFGYCYDTQISCLLPLSPNFYFLIIIMSSIICILLRTYFVWHTHKHTCTNLTHSLKWYSSNQLIREMSIYQIGYEWVPLSVCSCLCIQYICTNVLIYIEPCRVCVRSLRKLWMCLLLILQKFKFVTVAAAAAAAVAHNRA